MTELNKPPRSRAGGVWVVTVLSAVVLLLLLIFLLENGQRVDVAFFGGHARLPMGLALLLAAVFGMLLVALPGTARVLQLRVRARRQSAAPATRTPDAEPTQSLDSGH
jgi:putative membrane protein